MFRDAPEEGAPRHRHPSFDCESSEILELGDNAAVRAAEIYSDLKASGSLIGDADILIAASALVNGLDVVTNNETHFKKVKGLRVENWMK